jgi:hypothetical protein
MSATSSATNTVITVPPNGAIAQNDSNGKELKFKEVGNDTLQAEGSDGLIYTVQKQVQQAILSVQKKRDDKLPRINDPYYQRMAANAPKAKGEGGNESTEARETKEFGKAAKRTDVNTPGAVK